MSLPSSQLTLPENCATREHWPVSRALTHFPRDEFDYAWLVDMPPIDPRLVAGWLLLFHDEDSMLYRIPKPTPTLASVAKSAS